MMLPWARCGKARPLVSIASLFTIGFAVSAATLLTTALASPHPPIPASVFSADKGIFRILVNGQEAGQEEFQISPSGANWVIRGTSTLKASHGVTHVNGTLELHADGTPARYEWSTDGQKKASSTVTFNGTKVSVELRVGNNATPYTQQFTFNSPSVVVLDNNLYDQYAVLARLYDWNKQGVQTFSVLVPQEMTPGNITVESLGKQNSGGKQLDELRVKTEDLELDLYLDGGRLMRVVAPDSGAEIIRN